MKFYTQTGSIYEVEDGKVRRVNEGYGKRADGDWVDLLGVTDLEVGRSAILHLVGLDAYGEDDYGNRGPITTRITSPVTKIEEDE